MEVALNTVIKWRKRFFAEGMDGLADRKRSGRPRTFPALVVSEIKELACELPATSGVPLSRWSCTELARELVFREVVEAISAATVWRVLDRDAIRPSLHRSWISPLAPDALRICVHNAEHWLAAQLDTYLQDQSDGRGASNR